MKTTLFTLLFIYLAMVLGCGWGEKAPQTNSNRDSPIAPTPSPAPSAPPTGTVSAAPQRNLLAFGSGAVVVDNSSESNAAGEGARHINDEAFSGNWVSGDGQTENQYVTLELPARTTLETLIFDTNEIDYGKRAAKNVLVEISDISAKDGFQTVLEAELKDQAKGQSFPVSQRIGGRWLRITAKNNHGSPKATAIDEIRGYGEQESPVTLENISGTYKVDNYDEVHIKQEGTSITGCYNFEGGVLEGSVSGRTVTLTYTQKNDSRGFVVINLADGGKKLISTWWSGKEKTFDSAWKGEKISDKVGSCAHFKDLDKTDAAQEQLEKNLEATKRAIVYGINFDFNSDKLRIESQVVLDKVAGILKEHPDWNMTIEGHTDNVGGDAFNQALSEKRAAAVKNYLVAVGIEAARLSTAGMGLSKPIATNNSEAGRAQNRRVELVRP